MSSRYFKRRINLYLEIVKYITSHLEEKNPAMNNGWTPLHSAAQNGHLEIVKYITSHLEEKNPAKNDGWTSLHCAAGEGRLEIVKYLIENNNMASAITPLNYIYNIFSEKMHIKRFKLKVDKIPSFSTFGV